MTVANIMTMPKIQFFGNDGNPLNGGKVYTYRTGTLINKATYTSANMGTANSNPVILDAYGRASIWLDTSDGYFYTVKLTDSSDNLIWTVNDVS